MPHSKSEFYKSYYLNQAKQRGGSLPAFHGAPVQHGYGLGSMLRGLFRWAMPHVTAGAKSLGRQALKGGLGVAQDVMDGQNVSESLKNRAGKAGRAFVKDMASQKPEGAQTGRGKKSTKRKNQPKPTIQRQAKKQRTSSAKKQNLNFF